MLTLTLTGCAIKSCGNARTHTHTDLAANITKERQEKKERGREGRREMVMKMEAHFAYKKN